MGKIVLRTHNHSKNLETCPGLPFNSTHNFQICRPEPTPYALCKKFWSIIRDFVDVRICL